MLCAKNVLTERWTNLTRKEGGTVPRITEIVSKIEALHTLSEALACTRLHDILMEDGPYTLFAPSEEAFSELGTETLIALAADGLSLTQLLQSHIVAGRLTLRDLGGLGLLESLAGTELYVSYGPDGDSYIEEARVVRGDIEADNGVIHVVDLVILPFADETVAQGSTQSAVTERGSELVA